MNNSYLRQKTVSVAVALSLATLVAPSVMAEESSDSDNAVIMEETVVYGIRGSLQRAMEMKRNATGVVDGISSEEMGKFPDTNQPKHCSVSQAYQSAVPMAREVRLPFAALVRTSISSR